MTLDEMYSRFHDLKNEANKLSAMGQPTTNWMIEEIARLDAELKEVEIAILGGYTRIEKYNVSEQEIIEEGKVDIDKLDWKPEPRDDKEGCGFKLSHRVKL